MIKLFYGTDTVAVREAAFSLVSTLRGSDTPVTVIEAESYETGQLVSIAEAVSLFGGKQVYVLDSPFLNQDFKTELLNSLPALENSSHTFVIIEGSLLAAEKKKLTSKVRMSEEFQADKVERFNTFAIADALAKKDRRALWLLLIAARRSAVSDEEIIGILWWQLKALRLATLTKTASEAGLKDFPYQKAKQALSVFNTGELEQLSLKFITLYHDGHGGKRDLSLALEEFVLTV